VVYTDRAVNLMSSPFQTVMKDISTALNKVYNSDSVAIIPGSGTYAMEAVARQFGTDKKVLILRNGYFSFRWSDIFDVTKCQKEEIVLKGRAIEEGKFPYFAPMPIEEVVAAIEKEQPDVVFAPHVETSSGIILPDDYMKKVAEAVHKKKDAFFVIDSIASGNMWVDMKATGVDVLISAPQKGWSGPACAGLVMLNERAAKQVKEVKISSNSFSCNLPKWLTVMDAYVNGGFMYYTTLPTDALTTFRDAIKEAEAFGFEKTRTKMMELGSKVRALLVSKGFKSVAAPGFEAPGVVVSYSNGISGAFGKFKAQGLQIAGGVPLKLDEDTLQGVDTKATSFRLGLFGLDKLADVDGCVEIFAEALDKVVASEKQ